MAGGSESVSRKKYKNNDTYRENKYLLLDEGNLSQAEESDELFSDTDDKKEVIPFSPNVSKVTDCSSLNLSENSLLHTIGQVTTPSTAAIPSTPLSLVPFLTKINEQWSSDLETPQADKEDRKSIDSSTYVIDSVEKVVQKQSTPNVSNFKTLESKLECISPVISSTRERPRPKRRIFKTSICLDSTTASLNKEDGLPLKADDEKYVGNTVEDPSTGIIMTNTVHGQIIKTSNMATKLHNLDTSTQNFFNDISFSHIDNLCAKDLEKEESTSKNIKSSIYNAANEESANDFQDLIDYNKINLRDESLQASANHSVTVKDSESNVNRNLKTEIPFLPMPGFSTASGKKVLVTESALSKARLLFATDMESEIHTSQENALHPDTSAFTNQSLSSSKESLTLLSDQSDFAKYKLNKTAVNPRARNPKFKPPSSTSKTTSCKFVPILKEVPIMVNQSNTAECLKEKSTTADYPQKTELLARGCSITGVKSITATKEDLSTSFHPAHSQEKLLTGINTKMESKFSSFGFSTASGKAIAVSKEALLKASALFANDELDDNPSVSLEEENYNKCTFSNIKEAGDVSASMTSTRNSDTYKPSNVINDTAFVEHKNTIDTSKVLPHRNHTDKENSSRNSCFTWGNPLTNISRRTLGKVGKPFTDLKFNNIVRSNSAEMLQASVNFKNKRDTHNFMIASDNTIGFSDEACSKAKQLFPGKSDYNMSKHNDVLNQSICKRKISDVNNDTPPSKSCISTVKKSRYENELHTRRLFNDKFSDVATRTTKISNTPLTSAVNSEIACKESFNNATITINKKKVIDNNSASVSHEIVASTVALLADEKHVSNQDSWNFPIENNVQEDDSNAPSSPVIGRRPTTVKRTSIGKRKGRKSLEENYSSMQKTIPREEMTKDTDNICKLSENDPNIVHNKICKSTLSHTQQNTDAIKNSILHEVKDANLAEKKQKLEKDGEKCNGPATEYGDTQMMIDFIIQSENISHKRTMAALDQDKMISLKKLCKARPTISKLLFYKQSNSNARITWKTLTKATAPTPRGYSELIDRKISSDISEITAATAATYKFRCADFYGQDVVQSNVTGIEVDDGAKIILDENGYAGIVEIKRAFLASPGVDPNLLPTGWVENHYRWIVWKLASMDRMNFGTVDLPRALIPSSVLGQLKYRYDREIDRSERSAIRRIVEKDDVASRTMVLCVSSVTKTSLTDQANTSAYNEIAKTLPTPWKLSLTDGWYNINAKIDHDMIRNIVLGKVKEGTKLVTYGAELLNCDEGCFPLEISDNVCLKIHTNSTRRARWYAKLGYQRQAGPIHSNLRNITPNGGLVGKIKVVVARVYPLSYCERTASGESIFRNARSEEKAIQAYEAERQSKMEAFYAEAEKNFDVGKKASSSQPDSMDLLAMEWTENREKLSKEEYRSRQEREELLNECRTKEEDIRRKLNSRLHENLPPRRNVTPLLKIRIVDEDNSAILSIWSPPEDIGNIIAEGNCISICNVTPSGRSVAELRLNAGRNTVFNREMTLNISYKERIFTPFHSISNSLFAPAYREFDTVGIIVSMENDPHGMKNFQVVHLVYPYENLSSFSYLSILFWQGVTAYGYTDILTVGSFVGCINLEYRGSTTWSKSVAYCTERTIFTRNPRQKYLLREFQSLKELILEPAAYVAKCSVEISRELQKNISNRAQCQKTPNSDKKEGDPNRRFICSQGQDSATSNSVLNNQGCETPKSLGIRRRIEKLECYGEPPPLSPIILKNSSKRVSLDFQSPVRKENGLKIRKMSVNNNKINSTHSPT